MRTQEMLLLLDDTMAAQEISDRAAEGYRVISVFPPRIVVAELDESQLEELQRDEGVRFIVEGVVSKELLEELAEDEKLFVNGWMLKQKLSTKKRTGDGLSWDASGFLPPDPPPGSK